MDPSDSHQPFDCTTSTYVTEAVTAQNMSPLTTLTLNELNRVETHVEPGVEPQVETQVEPQVQPQAPSEAALVQAQPSLNHRPYTDMIYEALVALNERAGSTKLAISRYIKRLNPNLPDSHDGLMTHHLKVMMDLGILTKVKNSYQLADSSPPEENVAVAAAAADVDAGPVAASGSEIPPTYTGSLVMVPVSPSGSASQPLKRGRGRPPKPKTETPQQQQPIDAQPISQVLQPSITVEPSAVQPSGEQPELSVTNPTHESAKRGSGRPRKDGSGLSGSTENLTVMMKRRGWPTSCRATGRERNPISVPAPPASVISVVTDGAGRSETPMRGGSGGLAALAQAAGLEEAMAVAAVMKRGPGRPPKRGRGRGRGRTAGRPIKDTPRPVTRTTGTTQKPGYGELKRKIDLANEKVKEILNVLDAGIITRDNQAGVQATQEMEELIQMTTVELQAKEEGQLEGPALLIEAETQGMELGQGSRGGGGEQAQIQTLPETQPQTQTQTLTQPHPQLQPETMPLPQTQTLIQPQPQTLSESQPQTMPLPQTLTLTQPEPDILPELHNLPEIERLPELDLGPLTLTQPQQQILPQIQPNTEAEEMDEDIFRFLK